MIGDVVAACLIVGAVLAVPGLVLLQALRFADAFGWDWCKAFTDEERAAEKQWENESVEEKS